MVLVFKNEEIGTFQGLWPFLKSFNLCEARLQFTPRSIVLTAMNQASTSLVSLNLTPASYNCSCDYDISVDVDRLCHISVQPGCRQLEWHLAGINPNTMLVKQAYDNDKVIQVRLATFELSSDTPPKAPAIAYAATFGRSFSEFLSTLKMLQNLRCDEINFRCATGALCISAHDTNIDYTETHALATPPEPLECTFRLGHLTILSGLQKVVDNPFVLHLGTELPLCLQFQLRANLGKLQIFIAHVLE
jgi:hypothetical protein